MRNAIAHPYRHTTLSNVAVQVTTGPAILHGVHAKNSLSSDLFLNLYDHAAAVAASTTRKQSLCIPRGDGAHDGILSIDFTAPILFDAALAISCSTAPTTNTGPATPPTLNLRYGAWGSREAK